jgi:tetratricopeptide (TPR) repeat protein
MAELSASLAEGIMPSAYPQVVIAQLCAHAWKDVGHSLAYLGRYDDALLAIDRAEASISPFGALGHDYAIIQFVRAKILLEVDRQEEVRGLLAACKKVFREHGDSRRLVLCGIAEGVRLHRLRRYREAREAYLLLLAETRDSIDTEPLACLHNLIGFCSVDLGDYEAAEVHLSTAIELFKEVHEPLSAAKAELGRGRLFVRRGEIDRGVAHLLAIRSTFLRQNLTEEAGICALEMVEALLLRGNAEDAEALARQVISEFTAARLNRRAITALGYLQEAIASRRASVATVINVREYIVGLRTSPEREFTMAL